MTKKHEKPEFLVICQNEANAKFFVASDFKGVYPSGQTTPQPDPSTGVTEPDGASSKWDVGGDIDL